jgi:hypothetical protein
MKSRVMRWVGHEESMGDRRGAYGDLAGRPEGKGPRGRQRRTWEGNIKMDIQEVRWGDIDSGSG